MTHPDVFQFYLFQLSLMMVLAVGFIFFVAFYRKQQEGHLLRQQQMDFDHRSAILRARIEVHEQSMALVSDELHDNLAQLMTLAKQYLDLASERLQDSREKEFVVLARDLQLTVISKIRNVSHSLSNDLLRELGLLRSAERMMEPMERIGISARFETTGEQVPLPREQDLLIFRIIQEFIQNVIKHAKASRCSMRFHYGPDTLELEIRDNGKGFEPDMLESGDHLGLVSIRNRVALLNATMHLETGAGKGCCFRLLIPLISRNDK